MLTRWQKQGFRSLTLIRAFTTNSLYTMHISNKNNEPGIHYRHRVKKNNFKSVLVNILFRFC